MPRSKNYLVYPDSFYSLVSLAVTKPVEIDCGTKKDAMRLMGRLYGFFQALEVASKKPETPEDVRAMRRMSTKVRLQVEDTKLLAYPGDEEPLARLVAQAVEQQTGDALVPTQATPVPSAMLLELLKKESAKDE